MGTANRFFTEYRHWRPHEWENPFKKEIEELQVDDESPDGVVDLIEKHLEPEASAYEKGADAMLKTLRERNLLAW